MIREMARMLTGSAAIALIPALAWGGAPSIRPDMPPEIRSWRETILPAEDYANLVERWKAYADAHPKSAVALVELSRAMRYGRAGTQEDRDALIEKALTLDPDCPEALEAAASNALVMSQDFDAARRYGEKAVALAPDWPDPRFTLMSVAMVRGDTDDVRAQAEGILAAGGFPAPLVDFAYNLLQSAAPNGIVFTNGDNDTYPLIALQLARGVRPDVKVANLSLLNLEDYARNIWQGMTPAPFTPDEMVTRHTSWLAGASGSKEIFSRQVLDDLAGRIASGAWTGPAYLTVTVSDNYLDCCRGRLELEGLLWRITKSAAGGSDEAMPVLLPRTLQLFQSTFRLDSATDLGYPWGPASAVGRLMTNYPAVLRATAAALAAKGDLAGVRYAMTTAIRILEFHGNEDHAKAMADYWRKLDPAGAGK